MAKIRPGKRSTSFGLIQALADRSHASIHQMRCRISASVRRPALRTSACHVSHSSLDRRDRPLEGPRPCQGRTTHTTTKGLRILQRHQRNVCEDGAHKRATLDPSHRLQARPDTARNSQKPRRDWNLRRAQQHLPPSRRRRSKPAPIREKPEWQHCNTHMCRALATHACASEST